MRTLQDLHSDEPDEAEFEPSGFQMFTPSGKQIVAPQNKSNFLQSPDFKNELLKDALGFQNYTGSKGSSNEFEKMYDKIMNPSQYKKKYGHLDKQKLMPPSYITKKPRKKKEASPD